MNATPADPRHAFSDDERRGVYRAIYERRDMRHFSGGRVAGDVLQRLLSAAHHAPSVGFMQPRRFIRVTDPTIRQQLHAVVEHEPIALLRLAPVKQFYAEPMLQTEHWASRAALSDMVFEDRWGLQPGPAEVLP